MSDIVNYIISVEGKSDGSCNCYDYKRPGLSLYTDRKKAILAVFEYISDNLDLNSFSHNICEKMFDECILGNYDGIYIDSYTWLRLHKIKENDEDLQEDYWCNWKLQQPLYPQKFIDNILLIEEQSKQSVKNINPTKRRLAPKKTAIRFRLVNKNDQSLYPIQKSEQQTDQSPEDLDRIIEQLCG